MPANRVLGSSKLSFRRAQRDPRPLRWILLIVALLLAGGLLSLASAILLMRSQELTAPVIAAGLQEREGGLYGPAGDGGTYAYKLERYRLARPDILIVGSRRLAALPGEAFNTTAYNAAGAVDSLDQLTAFILAAVDMHAPKSILIGLDFWWFNPNPQPAPAAVADTQDFAAHLADPALWLLTGQVSPKAWFGGMFPSRDAARGIGALALLNGQGWDAYGRYEGLDADDEEPAALRDVHVGPSAAALQQLGDLIAELNRKSVEVILMVPPMAASLRVSLAKDPENRLVPLWRDAIQSMGQRMFNLDDATALGSSDCEFIDDLTGGEVTYIRTLDAIGNFGGTVLSRAIDHDMVSSLIASNTGHIRLVELLPGNALPDTLFRDSACNKEQ